MLILVVEAGTPELGGLAHALAAEPDVEVEAVADATRALDRLAARPFDAVVTELDITPLDGVELVRRIRQLLPKLPLVVLTPDATADRAVASMRAGATDFVRLPVAVGALVMLLRRALGQVPLREQLERLRLRDGARARDFLQGDHPRLDAVRSFAERVALLPDATVLITGEAGTGKGCLANALHALSDAGRFVEVACATIPHALIESELSGHEGGPFTDPRVLKRDLLDVVAGGTLFLDEIDALPTELQAKLLVFLESRQNLRSDGTQRHFRVVAASSQDLHAAVRQGRFRSDLLQRLEVASIVMPALREMPEVTQELAVRFATDLADKFHQPRPVLDASTRRELVAYSWPGNVRELRNAVERALIFHDGGPLVIRPSGDGMLTGEAHGVVMPSGLTLDEVERRYLLAALESFAGDYASLAAQLGISRKTLWEKRRRWVVRNGGGERTCTPRSA